MKKITETTMPNIQLPWQLIFFLEKSVSTFHQFNHRVKNPLTSSNVG